MTWIAILFFRGFTEARHHLLSHLLRVATARSHLGHHLPHHCGHHISHHGRDRFRGDDDADGSAIRDSPTNRAKQGRNQIRAWLRNVLSHSSPPCLFGKLYQIIQTTDETRG